MVVVVIVLAMMVVVMEDGMVQRGKTKCGRRVEGGEAPLGWRGKGGGNRDGVAAGCGQRGEEGLVEGVGEARGVMVITG